LQYSPGGLYKKTIASPMAADGSVQPHFIHHALIVRLLTPLFQPREAPSIAIFSLGRWIKRYSLA
jgi:hypothetical protein